VEEAGVDNVVGWLRNDQGRRVNVICMPRINAQHCAACSDLMACVHAYEALGKRHNTMW